MRIDRLDLIAFGPFTDRVLEFAPNRVELIYGPNGAGKSTALRGLTGLLYGVAVRTMHANSFCPSRAERGFEPLRRDDRF